MAGLELLSTIQGGYMTPFRSSMWLWLVIVVAVLWVTEIPLRQAALFGVAGLCIVAVSGSLYWMQSVSDHQRRLDRFDAMAWRVGQLIEKAGTERVVIVGSDKDWRYYLFTQEAALLRSRTAFENGITPRYCRPKSCALARDRKVIDKKVDVFVRDDYVVIRPPASE